MSYLIRVLIALWNKLSSPRVEETIKPIKVDMSFDYKGPGQVHTVKTINTPSSYDPNIPFLWDNILIDFKDSEVIYNNQGCYMIVLADQFKEMSSNKRINNVFKRLQNPPNGLKMIALTKEEYEAKLRKKVQCGTT